jgi:hypothetical protein
MFPFRHTLPLVTAIAIILLILPIGIIAGRSREGKTKSDVPEAGNFLGNGQNWGRYGDHLERDRDDEAVAFSPIEDNIPRPAGPLFVALNLLKDLLWDY